MKTSAQIIARIAEIEAGMRLDGARGRPDLKRAANRILRALYAELERRREINQEQTKLYKTALGLKTV